MSKEPKPPAPARVTRAANAGGVMVKLGRQDTDHGRAVAGSSRDLFNNAVLLDAISTQWEPTGGLTPQQHQDQGEFVALAMAAFKPRDPVEGLLAAQAVALHGMAMECARKAQLAAQPHEIAQGMRKSAINASRMFTEIVDVIDRRHGKQRRQVVRVEKVMIAPGAQALVGIANGGGGGSDGSGTEDEAHEQHAPRLAHGAAVGVVLPPVRGEEPERQPVPSPRDAGQAAVPAARRARNRP